MHTAHQCTLSSPPLCTQHISVLYPHHHYAHSTSVYSIITTTTHTAHQRTLSSPPWYTQHISVLYPHCQYTHSLSVYSILTANIHTAHQCTLSSLPIYTQHISVLYPHCQYTHSTSVYLLLPWDRRKLSPHGPDLQQGSKLDSADRAHAGLIAQGLCTCAAKAQVATRQNERVAHVRHADDTFCSTVLHFLVRVHVLHGELEFLGSLGKKQSCMEPSHTRTYTHALTHVHTHTHTHTHTHAHTHTHTHTHTSTHTHKHTHILMERFSSLSHNAHMKKETNRQTETVKEQRERKTDREAEKKRSTKTDRDRQRQTDGETDRLADKEKEKTTVAHAT